MLNKIVIVDFEDSFTYNIASTIFPFCDDVKVIFHQDFFEPNFFNKLENNQKNIGIILGPGPGNPKEYEKYFNQIQTKLYKYHLWNHILRFLTKITYCIYKFVMTLKKKTKYKYSGIEKYSETVFFRLGLLVKKSSPHNSILS